MGSWPEGPFEALRGLIVVPWAKDPGGLLRRGECSAVPPRVAFVPRYGTRKPCPHCQGPITYEPAPTEQSEGLYVCTSCDQCIPTELALEMGWKVRRERNDDDQKEALPLLWEGRTCWEAWDRFRRVMPADWLGFNGHKGHPPLPRAFRWDGELVEGERNRDSKPDALPTDITTGWEERGLFPSLAGMRDAAGLAVSARIASEALLSEDMSTWTSIPMVACV